MKVTEEQIPTLVAALKRTEVFGNLPDESLDRISRSGEIVEFGTGANLFREGDAGDAAYILVQGEASVFRGRQKVVTRGPGECVGEIALIDDCPRSATVRTDTNVVALVIRSTAFDQLLLDAPFTRRMLVALSGKIREGDSLLWEAIEQLRQVQALKDDLFSLIVHDLRTPLTSIKAVVDLMAEGHTSKELLANGKRSAAYMQTLLSDVLDIRLLEEGELPLEPSSIDPTEFVSSIVELIEQHARERKVVLRSVVDHAGMMLADRKLLRRAVENLLMNALKYSPAGSEVELRIGTCSDGTYLEVLDRGPGVPVALRGNLFKKFGSVEKVQGSPRRGHGLGLHFVALIARSHGGDVNVSDREEGGSVFRIVIPMGAAGAR